MLEEECSLHKRKAYLISNFVCPECGMIMPLPRPKGKQRKRGHIKDLWCPKCRCTRKFIEGVI